MRETKYTDISQTKERKKFIWLCFMLILLTAVCLCLTTFILAATRQDMGSRVHVHYEPSGDFIYSQNTDGTYTVTGLKNTKLTVLDIPSENKGESVTGIGDNAFDGNSTIISITIPETITKIGTYAFKDTSYLTEINYNVTSTSSSIVGSSAYPFYNAGKSGSGITVNFGANVTRVADNLFYAGGSSYAPNIPKVNFLGNKVKAIGNQAFTYCTKLTSITIPEGVTSIGDYAFRYCSGLTSITIPETISSLGDYAFSGTSKLTEINYNIKAFNRVDSIHPPFSNAGQYGYGLGATVNFGENVTEVPEMMFDGANIKIVNFLGNKVKTIEDYAFENCSLLTSIAIPSSVTSVYSRAFNGCSRLTSLKVDSGNTYYTSRNSKTGAECNIILSIQGSTKGTLIAGCEYSIIPDDGSVTSISYNAFDSRSYLRSIDIPNSVKSIGERAFNVCERLSKITISSSVTSIGSDAFYRCSALKDVTIESGNIYTAASGTDYSNAGGLLQYATTIKVLTSCMDGRTNTFLNDSSKFTKSTSGLYTVFTKI